MKLTKKTVLNVLLILFVVSFFVTPLGHYGKVLLNRLFSFSPSIIEETAREQIADYDWKLKDDEWNFFSFEKSRGKVVLINFWASWKLPSEAELASIQKLYDRYKGQMDFYIITNEERPPVEEFMQKHEFTFPVTYLIIGEKAPFDILEPPASYLLDKKGNIVIKKEGISDWDTAEVQKLLDELIQE
ncbi:TlpA disulfide reductase family protein [Allomuricauda sp. d1]|uniref:TlpA family protein disulfide reductase n=1 Tax=Allomuricauda sp. d1 TaxID=3136725 RepID=UPI0031CDD816